MMTISLRNVLLSVLACGSATMVVIACGSDESKFKEEGPPPSFAPDGGFGDATAPIITDNEDPPVTLCGGDAAAPPAEVTGSLKCPSDKNLPGCGCDSVGQTAACWTGYRKNRNVGACKDGVTTCKPNNETSNAWGECVGEVLPVSNAGGAEGCSCFSVGEWNIANTSPCIANNNGYYAYSTMRDGTGQATNCGGGKPIPPMGTVPEGSWSTDTLKVDCAGKFKLCYRIKVGDFKNPQPTDCVLGESCIDAEYTEVNAVQALPDLPGWASTDGACAQKWEVDTPANVSPGYGEMIVRGQTMQCQDIGQSAGQDYVFHRVQYCPRTCRDAANANNPECVECKLASSGTFH